MSNKKYYCPNCGEHTMVKDADGYFFCPNCRETIEEEMYDGLLEYGADFERFINVYPEVYDIEDNTMFCPYCGHPIKEKEPGNYICSGSFCDYDPNEDPDFMTDMLCGDI